MSVELGQVAYESYRTFSDGVSLVSGAPIPEWSDLPPRIRSAWRAAADGVRMFMESVNPDPRGEPK